MLFDSKVHVQVNVTASCLSVCSQSLRMVSCEYAYGGSLSSVLLYTVCLPGVYVSWNLRILSYIFIVIVKYLYYLNYSWATEIEQ